MAMVNLMPRTTPLLVVAFLLASCAHSEATYRLGAPVADAVALDACNEISATQRPTIANGGFLLCEIMMDVAIEIRFAGEIIRVKAPSQWDHTNAALILGRLAQARGARIELERLK